MTSRAMIAAVVCKAVFIFTVVVDFAVITS